MQHPASLARMEVLDAMHPGVISCPAEVTVTVVARMMASYRVHAVIVLGDRHAPAEWSVVSDLDLARAVGDGALEATAGSLAREPVLVLAPRDGLSEAVSRMVATGTSHAVVVDPRSGRPVGVLSTLDVARAIAGLD